jgi:hypothetical protein
LVPAVLDPRAIFAQPHLRVVVRRTVAIAFMCFALAAAAPAGAWNWDETKPALRLSLGLDVYRAAGAMVASARYGGSWNAKASAWVRDVHVQPEAPNFLLGGGYVWTKSKWRFGAGLVWIDEENSVNGTRWNFDLSAAYDMSDRVFFEYQHYSHGAMLGIKKDLSNGSWNLMSVGLIF